MSLASSATPTSPHTIMEPRDVWLAITTLVLFAAALIAKPVVMARVDAVVASTKLNDRPLPDVMHALLPDWRSHFKWGDIFVGITLTVFVAYSAVYQLWTPMLQAACAFALFILLKVFINAVTILPDPSGMCEVKGSLGQCNDLMPSGHMAAVFIALFAIWGHADVLMKAVMVALAAATCFITLATRNHYTIDVIMSGVVTYALWALAR